MILTLKISDLSRGGAGVGRDNEGRIVFVPFTAPGDEVEVEILDVKKRYSQGKLIRILTPSPLRVAPPCSVFGQCGGCDWQHIPYDFQWKTKVKGVKHALSRLQLELSQPINSWPVEELPAEQIWEYRNRIQLRGDRKKIGFYAPRSHTLIPIERCEIARPEINAALPTIREQGDRLSLPYKVEVEVTESQKVQLIWNAKHGSLGFRQVHDLQNEKLRLWVSQAVRAQSVVWDLYGGSGNLSMAVMQKSQAIKCVDNGARSPRTENSQIPSHFQVFAEPVLKWLKKQVPVDPPAFLSVILDPPREGLGREGKEIVSLLNQLKAQQIIAVGCDPDAWARDLHLMICQGWKVKKLAVLDLFPQTAHVESLALLERL